MKKSILAFSLLVVFAVIFASCASNNSNGGSGGGPNTIDVTMSDLKFTPNTWNVSAGSQVTVNIKNTGSVNHTWTVMKTPISGSYKSADASNVYYNSEQVAAGTSKTVTFTAPSTPGTYQVICTVPGHFEAGMSGQLIVK